MKNLVLLIILGSILVACHGSGSDNKPSYHYPHEGVDAEGRNATFYLHESRCLTYSIPIGEETKTYYKLNGESLGEIMDFRPFTDGRRLFFKGVTLDGKNALYYPEQGPFEEFFLVCDVYEFFEYFIFYQNGDEMMLVKGPRFHNPLAWRDMLTQYMTTLITFQDDSCPVVVELGGGEWKARQIFDSNVTIISDKEWDKLCQNAQELPSIGDLSRLQMRTSFMKTEKR